MKAKHFLSAAISLALLTSASSALAGNIHSKIFNGEETAPGEFPFFVGIITNDQAEIQPNSHLCGGVLINKDWFVTAAHCVDKMDADKYEALIGLEQYWPKTVYNQSLNFEKIVIHSDYDHSGQNDIALVKLAKKAKSNSFAKLDGIDDHIKLPVGTPLTAIGFGETNNSMTSATLLKTQAAIIDQHFCIDKPEGYPDTNFNPANNLCTGNPDDVSQGTTGKGDSGGPLMFLNGNGDYIVSGLVSRGLWLSAGQTTKVAYHADWIRKTIQSDEQPGKAPIATITATSEKLTPMSWVSLSGATSVSPEGISPQSFTYKWKVLNHARKVQLSSTEGVSTRIRLIDSASDKFDVKVQLTVIDPHGREAITTKEFKALK